MQCSIFTYIILHICMYTVLPIYGTMLHMNKMVHIEKYITPHIYI